jgi:predicted signal transduction protein with EAL and GGDEF domain
VLKEFARILKHEARDKVDRVGRYGGEEFMLLLPGTVLDAAVTFAERVRKEVEARTFTFDGGTLKRTASFGVSGWPHPRIVDCEALVRAADDALYVAKETGRNRVIRFDGDAFNAHIAEHGSEQLEEGGSRRSDATEWERPLAGDESGVADRGELRP